MMTKPIATAIPVAYLVPINTFDWVNFALIKKVTDFQADKEGGEHTLVIEYFFGALDTFQGEERRIILQELENLWQRIQRL